MSIDLHVDYPWQCYKNSSHLSLDGSTLLQCDFPRMDKGGLDKFIAALYLHDNTQKTIGPDKSWNAIRNQIGICKGYSDRVMIALEGGRLLNGDVARLAELQGAGCVYITLTHNQNTDWADSATDKMQHNGLTAQGKSLVKLIQAGGIFVDLSHASDQTALDVISLSTKPLLATHSGVRSLVDHPRNLSDFLIKEIVATGGLIGVPYASRFVRDADGVVEAIDHIANIAGNTDHIGIGSDLDGADTIIGDVSGWSAVLEPLSDLGYTADQIADIKGGNFLRLLNDARPKES